MFNISGKNKLTKEQQYKAYEDMLLVRRFEERCSQLYGTGAISGFCHLYIGQEAVIAGTVLAKHEGDNFITSYRSHAHAILSGIEPKYVLAELCGKATGCSKAKGGSMHMFNPKGNFYGGHGIVGAQVPIGTGLAFADKYLGNSNVTFTFLGDGAIHQGQVYESFNMASLWKLPVVYIVENNKYAMGTSVERSTSRIDLYNRGESFGIPGKSIYGMDIHEVYDAITEARNFISEGKGPVLLEIQTYRYRGHSMSDPATYRSQEEVQDYRQHKDPILHLKQHLLDQRLAQIEDLEKIENQVKKIISNAVKFSDESPEPNDSELFTYIYGE